mmetsp:Transcript_4270/g.10091  ORF Transcript_4270/g.10091 Transcript_4270/m.10091 type:complete len:207 (+) Transcript_4270:1196-1816(+)
MDTQHDGVALLGQALQELHHLIGSHSVQARSGLVQHYDRGPGQQLQGNGESSLLSCRDALDDGVANAGVCADLHAHDVDDALDALLPLGSGLVAEHEAGGVAKGLSDSEGTEEGIVGHDVAHDFPGAVGISLLSTQENGALDCAGLNSVGQEIHQGGLATTAGSQQRHQLACHALTGSIGEDDLGTLLRLHSVGQILPGHRELLIQ